MKGTSPFSRLAVVAAVLLAGGSLARAALVTVSFDSGSYTITDLDGSTALSGGNPAINGDGAVLQLGYFSSGTNLTPFAGTWVALTGEGGANAVHGATSIGDDFNNGAGVGTFAMTLSFDSTVAGTFNSLPAAGTPLAIRIYNAATIASSTYYQTISSTLSNWQWQSPAEPPGNPTINLSLDDTLSSLRREDGTAGGVVASGTFNTNLVVSPVPEPSMVAAGAMIALAAVSARRRRKSEI